MSFFTRVFATLFLALSASAAAADMPYNLFCAKGIVTIDQRNWSQMKAAIGPDVCNFGEFTTIAEARRHSSLFGGEGATCSCK